MSDEMSDLFRLRQDDLEKLACARCDDCAGTGKYRDEDGQTWNCSCQDDFCRRCDDAAFPSRFANFTLGDLDWERIEPAAARRMAQEYVANLDAYLNESIGLILSGGVGCGKTHLAVGIAKLAGALGYTVLFVNVPAWFQELREAYAANDSTRERDRLDEMRRADILILDDLGSEKPSDWARERLYLIVDYRTLTRRATFATTNRPLEELELAIGERVMSRLYGDALAITLAGEDYRQVERERRLQRIRENPLPQSKVRRANSGAPDCPICQNARFVRREVPVDHPDFGRAVPCECMRRA
jgi:DNA replication protein DnaC